MPCGLYVCINLSRVGEWRLAPLLDDITVVRENERRDDVQVEMDHRCLSLVQHGHGTAAKANTVLQAKAQAKSFTAEQVHDRSRFYRRAAQGIGSDTENALGLYYDGILGLTRGDLWFVYMLWL